MAEPVFQESDLHPSIVRALADMDITALSGIQRRGVTAALTGRDVTLCAPTGSGKTVAFCIPALQGLLVQKSARDDGTLVLILTPTRDLALQVHRVVKALCRYTSIGVELITGGHDFKYQRALFRKNPEVIIATPGRLVDHIGRGSTDFAALRTVVLDEADQMLDHGLLQEVGEIMQSVPASSQRWLYSATLPQQLRGALAEFVRQPIDIRDADGVVMATHTSHRAIICKADRRRQLEKLLSVNESVRVLIFCNTRKDTMEIATALESYGKIVILHGELSREERILAIDRFHLPGPHIMVASPVAARGLDIKNIDLVINYQLPDSTDEYLHRAGRAGRGGSRAECVSLISQAEISRCEGIEKTLGIDILGKLSRNRTLDKPSVKPSSIASTSNNKSRKPRANFGDGSQPVKRRR